MTLAGTRPILQDELLKYELHHRARIAIKPGITGMWQVSGRSDITDFEEVVRLDTEYISKGCISYLKKETGTKVAVMIVNTVKNITHIEKIKQIMSEKLPPNVKNGIKKVLKR